MRPSGPTPAGNKPTQQKKGPLPIVSDPQPKPFIQPVSGTQLILDVPLTVILQATETNSKSMKKLQR